MKGSHVNKTKSVCSTSQEMESPTRSLPDIYVCKEVSKSDNTIERDVHEYANMGKFFED